MDGGTVDDGDSQEIVAVVGIVDLHELSRSGDRQLFFTDGFLEVVRQGAEKESVLHPGGAMVREFGDLSLGHALFFVQESDGLCFLGWTHLESHEVLGECWDLVNLFRFEDAGRNGCVAKKFASRESAASGYQPPASAFPLGYDDGLQQALSTDRFRKLANAVIRDINAQRGAVHVDLIDVYILFHLGVLSLVMIVGVEPVCLSKSYPQGFPQTPS